MRRLGIAAVVILLILAGIWFSEKQPRPPEPSGAPASAQNPADLRNSARGTSPDSPPAPPPVDSGNLLADRAASPPPPTVTNDIPPPPLTVLDNLRVAIHDYQAQFGENPVGTNPEITEALMGKNPKQLNFIRPDSGLRVNEQGELVDGYGTPFFFHQLSGREMEIHSAGPDKKMWTYDDIVMK